MNPAGAGAGLALLFAGPPLYAMVQAGDLTWQAALVRWAVVAVVCALGATGIARLALNYEKAQDLPRRERLAEADRAIADIEALRAAGRPAPAPAPETGED